MSPIIIIQLACVWLALLAETARGAEPASNDPGFAEHLQLWFRADQLPLQEGAPVYRWSDSARHQRDAYPTLGIFEGSGSPPTFIKASQVNGRPAVRFEGNQGLGVPAEKALPIRGDAAYTIAVIGNFKRQEGNGMDVIVGFGEPIDGANAAPGRPAAGLLQIDRSPSGRHRIDHAGGFGRDAQIGPPASFASFYELPQLIVLTKRPGPMRETSAIYINGEPLGDGAGAGTSEAPDIRPRNDFSLFIGHAWPQTGALKADLAEIIIYDKCLSNEERRALERHLASKYDLPFNPPENSPAPELVGAADRQHWAFQTLSRPGPPKLKSAARADLVRAPIDAFLLAKLEDRGLSYSPVAEREVLIRRLYLDLIGLPPSSEALQAFLDDTSSSAYEQLADQLLASPHFGERWGRHWLDLVGYVDVTGNDQNAEQIILGPNKWRYRDYVIRSFNADKPFDRFLTEQIAGDELVDWRGAETYTPEIQECLVATGYLRTAIDDTHEVDLNKVPFRYQVVFDTVQIVGNSLFALTIQCARCHNHKFDPIPQRDYFRLMGLFTPALNPYAWLQPKDREIPDVSKAEQKRINAHNSQIEGRLQPLKEEKTKLFQTITNRVLEAKLEPIAPELRDLLRRTFATSPEKRDPTQKELAQKHDAQLKITDAEIEKNRSQTENAILRTLEKQIAALIGQKRSWGSIRAFFETGPPPRDYVFVRGDHEKRSQRVGPGVLSILADTEQQALVSACASDPPDSTGRRLAFAQRLAHPNSRASALFARVLMNRIWQQLFGRGLVPTPDNFGMNGMPPTHPELLEWLAANFIDSGWRIKPMLKQMVMSAAYQQDSTTGSSGPKRLSGSSRLQQGADPMVADPNNDRLWRMRLRRLESEIVRDAILTVSGKLDRLMFGPAVPLQTLPDGSIAMAPDDKLPTPTSKWRRTIYLMSRRNFHLPLLASFDQPVINGACARRLHSSIVLQPLTMLNDAFVLEQAEAVAARVAARGPDLRQRVDSAFVLVLGRHPASDELEWSLKLLAAQAAALTADRPEIGDAQSKGLAHLCQMLLNSSEFLYIP